MIDIIICEAPVHYLFGFGIQLIKSVLQIKSIGND